MLLKTKILFVRLAIVVNVLLAEASPIYDHGEDNVERIYEDALQFLDCEENNQRLSDEDTSNYNMGRNIILKYIYKGPVFLYNNYNTDAENPFKLMARENNARTKNRQNCKSLQPPIIESFFHELEQIFKNVAQLLKTNALEEKRVVKQEDKDMNDANRGINEIYALIQEILTKSDQLSTRKYSMKFVEQTRKNIETNIEKIINYMQDNYELIDGDDPELDEIWIKKVMLHLMKMKKVLDDLLKRTDLEDDDDDDKGVLKQEHNKYTRTVTNGRAFEFKSSPQISALIEEILTKSAKFIAMKSPMKSVGKIRNEVEIKINNNMDHIKAHYKSTNGVMTSTKKVIGHLMEMNKVLDYVLENISLNTNQYISIIDTNRGIILDEKTFSQQVSTLIENILRKSETLSIAKYTTQRFDEVRNEIENEIEKIKIDTEKEFQFIFGRNPQLDEIWMNKVIFYLIDTNKNLNGLMEKYGLEVENGSGNDANEGIALDDIKSLPQIHILIEKILTTSVKMLTTTNPMKSVEGTRTEVETKIENIINHIQKYYKENNLESDKSFINKVMTYLIEMNEVSEYLLKEIGLEKERIVKQVGRVTRIDVINANRGIILNKMTFSQQVSTLIENILRKSEKLSKTKYITEPFNEIRNEIENVIEKIIIDTEKDFKFSVGDNLELDEIWMNKVIYYLMKRDQNLDLIIKKLGLEGKELIEKFKFPRKLFTLIEEYLTKAEKLSFMKNPSKSVEEIKMEIYNTIREIIKNTQFTEGDNPDFDAILMNEVTSYLMVKNNDISKDINDASEEFILNSSPKISNLIKEIILMMSKKYPSKSIEDIRYEIYNKIQNIIQHTQDTETGNPKLNEIWMNQVISYLSEKKDEVKTEPTQTEFPTEIHAWIEKILRKAEELSLVKFPSKSVEDIRNEIQTTLINIMEGIQRTDGDNPDFDKIWKNKVIIYLIQMYKHMIKDVEDSLVVFIHQSSRDIYELIEGIQRKLEKSPSKPVKEINNEIYNQILSIIQETKHNERDNPKFNQIWIDEVTLYLNRMNIPRGLLFNKIKLLPEVSTLIENILVESNKLPLLKLPTKSEEEIIMEIDTKIKEMIKDTQITNEKDPDVTQELIDKVISYMCKMYQDIKKDVDDELKTIIREFSPQVSYLVEKINRELENSPSKFAKDINKEIFNRIISIIHDTKNTNKGNPNLKKIWMDLVTSYLSKMNIPRVILFHEIKSLPQVSTLIEDILTEFAKLPIMKYPKKSEEEIIMEIDTKIKEMIKNTQITNAKDPDITQELIDEVTSYLFEMYKDISKHVDDEFIIIIEASSLDISNQIEEIKRRLEKYPLNLKEIYNQILSIIQDTKDTKKGNPNLKKIWMDLVKSYLSKIDLPRNIIFHEIKSLPQVSTLIEEILTEFAKVPIMNHPKKSEEEIKKEIDNEIQEIIKNTKIPHENDIDVTQELIDKVISYLIEKNNYIRKYVHDGFETIIEDSSRDISNLIEEIKRRLEKYSPKNVKEIIPEIYDQILSIIQDTKNNDRYNPKLQKIWIEKVISYLREKNIPRDILLNQIKSLPEISTLIEEILTESAKMSIMKHPKTSAEEIKKEIDYEIQEIIKNTEIPNENEPEINKDLIDKVTSYLFDKIYNINKDVCGAFKTFIHKVSPKILKQIEKLETKLEKYPLKSFEEIKNGMCNKILSIIEDTKHNERYNPKLKVMWIEKVISYLSEKNIFRDILANKIKSLEVVSTLIKEILRESAKLLIMNQPTKSAEEIKMEIDTKIDEIIKNSRIINENELEVKEELIDKVISYLIEKNKDISEDVIYAFEEFILRCSREISNQIEKIQRKLEAYPSKYVEEIKKEIYNNILSIIQDTQQTERDNPKLKEIWMDLVTSYLSKMDIPRDILCNKIKSLQKVSALIEEILSESAKYSFMKYPSKSVDEIRKEIDTKIKEIIKNTHDSVVNEDLIHKVISYLTEKYKDIIKDVNDVIEEFIRKKIKSSQTISTLVKAMLQKLKNSPLKFSEETKKEMYNKILSFIQDTYRTGNPKFKEDWMDLVASYLREMNISRDILFYKIKSSQQVSTLIEDILRVSAKLSMLKHPTKSQKKIKMEIDNKIVEIIKNTRILNENDPDVFEDLIYKVTFYLIEENKKISNDVNDALDTFYLKSSPEIFTLIQEILKQYAKDSSKSVEEMRKEMYNKIFSFIQVTQFAESDNPKFKEIWTNRVISYLMEIKNDISNDGNDIDIIFNRIITSQSVSTLLEESLRKSEKLFYPLKTIDDIRMEIFTQIKNIIIDTKITEGDFEAILINKVRSYLIKRNQELDNLIQSNDDSGHFMLNEVKSFHQVSSLIEEILKKTEKLQFMKYSTKSVEDTNDEINLIIESMIRDYKNEVGENNFEVDHILVNKVTLFLTERLEVLDHLLTQNFPDETIVEEDDDDSIARMVMELKSFGEIADLIDSILMKAEKLQFMKSPSKSVKDIKREIDVNIARLIMQLEEEMSRDEESFDDILVNNVKLYLIEMNEDLQLLYGRNNLGRTRIISSHESSPFVVSKSEEFTKYETIM